MSENLKPFNAHKFWAKMNTRGYDCFVHTIGGVYKKESGPLKGQSWEKDTVYMKKDDSTFLEYVGTSTGSWFTVTNKNLLEEFRLFY